MADIFLLATGPLLGWLLYMGLLEPLYCPDEMRWNHILWGVDNPRRVRPRESETLQDLQLFGWEWDSLTPPPAEEIAKTWKELAHAE